MNTRQARIGHPGRGNGEASIPSRGQASLRHSEALEYVRSMLGQLRTLAEAEQADMLAYLIEMAYLEASDIMRGERPARIGRSHFGS